MTAFRTTPEDAGSVPPLIAGPVDRPSRPKLQLPVGACDSHAHLFGPCDRFPFTEGRGYTPPETPLERYLGLLDHLGFDRGVIVQGNAHGYDNRVVLDAVEREPKRLRGVGITDARVDLKELRRWDALGMRGLRFHLFADDHQPGYLRGVGWDVLQAFLPALRELGWVAQLWIDWRLLPDIEADVSKLSKQVPVVIDHVLSLPACRGVDDPSFKTLLRLVGGGLVYAKLSALNRQSDDLNRYDDVRPMHERLVECNPERLLWGSDWPHTSSPAALMPDDGALVDLLMQWVPYVKDRESILVKTPQQLFWNR
uniref:amidohydrolase family protein n=1 Tax=Variovorax sp. BK018 TaxID=3450241 RepID=UPI004039E1A8